MSIFSKNRNEYMWQWDTPISTENKNRLSGLWKIPWSLINWVISTKNALLNTFSNTKQAGKDIWSEMKRWFGINPLKWWRSTVNMALILSQLAFVKPGIAAMNAGLKIFTNWVGTTNQIVNWAEYRNKVLIKWTDPKFWYFDGRGSAPAAPRTAPTPTA